MRIPATSANLGPGFDRLGLALELYMDLHASPASEWRFDLSGQGSDRLPLNHNNLIAKAFDHTCEDRKWPKRAMKIRIHNDIPLERGLGSSAAAIVAGVGLAYLVNEGHLDKQAMLKQATDIEGHPDNVGPAILGQVQLATQQEGSIQFQTIIPHDHLSMIVAIPESTAKTEAMRQALPKHYTDQELKQTDQLLGQLIEGIQNGHKDKLKCSQRDVLHQPYRFKLMPVSHRIFDWMCRNHNLDGGFLSGSGPTVGAWFTGAPTQARTEMKALGEFSLNIAIKHLMIDRYGVTGSGT